VNHHWAIHQWELARIVGPFFIVSQLDDLCLHSATPATRFAECYVSARSFPGGGKGYRLAREATTDGFAGDFLGKLFLSWKERGSDRINDIRSGTASFVGASFAPQHRWENLRVYASAMDEGIREAALARLNTGRRIGTGRRSHLRERSTMPGNVDAGPPLHSENDSRNPYCRCTSNLQTPI